MRKSSKKLLFILVLLLFVAIEITLRIAYGFGTMPLYIESKQYEYIYAPNQEMKRFGVYFYVNSYSQRSHEPDNNKKKILGLGDSVINGGSQTDHDSLATSIVSSESEFQMLNISAGSWGADNCAAYLKEHGIFNAKAMFVVLSSHDIGDNMNFEPIVGVHKSYPQEQYLFAINEVIDRYIFPRLFKSSTAIDPNEKVLKGIDKGEIFNKGWEELKDIAHNANIPLVIILHAELSELKIGDYNEKGKMIEQWANNNNIKFIKDITFMKEENYRDRIHINSSGQKVLAGIIMNELQSMSL